MTPREGAMTEGKEPPQEFRKAAREYLHEWSPRYQLHGDLARIEWDGALMEFHLANFLMRGIARHEAPAVTPPIDALAHSCFLGTSLCRCSCNPACGCECHALTNSTSPAVNQELKEALRHLMNCSWQKTIGGDMRVCIDSDSYVRLRALSEEETK